MNALIVALMTWISVATGLPVPDVLPEISFVSQQELRILSDMPADSDVFVAGIYDPETAMIRFDESWDESNVVDVSTLVHELTHHMGLSSEKQYACKGKAEEEAYEMQRKYLEEHGKDLFEELEINGIFYFMITSCQDFGPSSVLGGNFE